MFVCVCRAITDKQLKKAVAEGENFRQVIKQLGLGSECGQCVRQARVMIDLETERLSIIASSEQAA